MRINNARIGLSRPGTYTRRPKANAQYPARAVLSGEAVARKHPSLAPYFRVTDVREPVDLLQR